MDKIIIISTLKWTLFWITHNIFIAWNFYIRLVAFYIARISEPLDFINMSMVIAIFMTLSSTYLRFINNTFAPSGSEYLVQFITIVSGKLRKQVLQVRKKLLKPTMTY